MSKLTILQYVSAFVSIVGLLLIAFKLPVEGFIISLVASVLWAMYGWITKQYAIFINSFVYFIVEILGIINWR